MTQPRKKSIFVIFLVRINSHSMTCSIQTIAPPLFCTETNMIDQTLIGCQLSVISQSVLMCNNVDFEYHFLISKLIPAIPQGCSLKGVVKSQRLTHSYFAGIIYRSILNSFGIGIWKRGDCVKRDLTALLWGILSQLPFNIIYYYIK